VRAALTHPKTIEEKLSDRQIAEHVGVSDRMVNKYRTELESTAKVSQLSERKGKDGKVRKLPEKPPEPASITTVRRRRGRRMQSRNGTTRDVQNPLPEKLPEVALAMPVTRQPRLDSHVGRLRGRLLLPTSCGPSWRRTRRRGCLPERKLTLCPIVHRVPKTPARPATSLRLSLGFRMDRSGGHFF